MNNCFLYSYALINSNPINLLLFSGKMLVVGMHVEIKRSDGRIHGAVIAEVKSNGRFMVEWYEKVSRILREDHHSSQNHAFRM